MSAGTVMKWMKPVRWRLAPAAMMVMLVRCWSGARCFRRPARWPVLGSGHRAEAWFDGISTMKADFIQVASDGTTATGELHLRRPHRMKIIYDLDEPLILLTTPVWLHVDRPNDRHVTSYPISETPLSLILQEQVELRIGRVQDQPLGT